MSRSAINYSLVIVLACIVVVTMRVTLPSILAYDESTLFQHMKYNVVKVYISVTAVIVLEMLLIYLSCSAMLVISEWLAVLYVPLLIYAMHRTYRLCVLHLQRLISGHDADTLLLQYYQNYFENDDPKWLELQAKMGCCGLSGPQNYLDYLRQVPAVCYRKGVLITRGCEYVLYDAFHGVHQLSKLLIWLALGIQLVALCIYLRLVIRKYMYLICRSKYLQFDKELLCC